MKENYFDIDDKGKIHIPKNIVGKFQPSSETENEILRGYLKKGKQITYDSSTGEITILTSNEYEL